MGRPEGGVPWRALAVVGACLAWAVDNNLTRKVSAGDPVQIAMLKGLAAGAVNVLAGLSWGAKLPGVPVLLAAGVIGLFGYGLSLTLFVLALRHIGTARTGAYFSIAPFVGAVIAIPLLGESVSLGLGVAAALMGAGVWLHLTERHEHEHRHEVTEHDHLHSHDEHHRHTHGPEQAAGEPHSHPHRHEELPHSHPHYPDIHHRHGHHALRQRAHDDHLRVRGAYRTLAVCRQHGEDVIAGCQVLRGELGRPLRDLREFLGPVVEGHRLPIGESAGVNDDGGTASWIQGRHSGPAVAR
jgi:hypothetical protein